METRVLIPWTMPQPGRVILQKAGLSIEEPRDLQDERLPLEELMKRATQVDVLIPRGTQVVTERIMKANPNLHGIANYGVGYNNIDVMAATELGIPVTNTPDVLTETTADLAWALLMATARRLPQAYQYVIQGQWKNTGGETFMGSDIGPGGVNRPKVLGIIGFGRIGRAVARRSRGFRMRVIAHDPYREGLIEKTRGVAYRDLDGLLRESDFVSLHCPLTNETQHLIGAKELNLMKSTAILVNTARGAVVDEKALASTLKHRRIAAAGLDVFEKEPHISPALLKLDNVVLLPHIGSATMDTREQMAIVAAKNAVAMARWKKPVQIVNPQVFESEAYLAKSGERKQDEQD